MFLQEQEGMVEEDRQGWRQRQEPGIPQISISILFSGVFRLSSHSLVALPLK